MIFFLDDELNAIKLLFIKEIFGEFFFSVELLLLPHSVAIASNR